MIIIGITGTIGAGKGAVVEYLKTLNFRHFSAREFIVREIEKRGLPINRNSMTEVGNDLRAKHSPAYIIEQLYEQAKQLGQDAVIESIRTEGEVQVLKASGSEFHLISVDADPQIRYKRIVQRASPTDKISYQEFLADEAKEMNSADPNNQNIARCLELADFKILNNGSFEELHSQIDQIISAIRPYGKNP